MSVESILEQRAKEYGSYENQVVAITEIMNQLKKLRNEKNGMSAECWITPEDIENFFLVLKLCRLQTDSKIDTCDDLIGYATLIRDRRFKKEKVA